MSDRQGSRWWFFDADGTREVAQHRPLPPLSDGRPAARRRNDAVSPGYSGRKRADAVLTRMVVVQSHTQEWLGTYPMPGNGQQVLMLNFVVKQVKTYAEHHQLPLHRCVVRTDGEHGSLAAIDCIATSGLGFLTRCTHYQLLQEPEVQAALEAGTFLTDTHPDSGMQRDVFEVPQFLWQANKGTARVVRLIITRTLWPQDKPHRIGVRVGAWVFELFVTNIDSQACSAVEVLRLYLDRGSMEAAFAQEEEDFPVSHWASNKRCGLWLWHLLAQWIGNVRLWMAWKESPGTAQTTDCTASDAETTELKQMDLLSLLRQPLPAAQTSAVTAIDPTEQNQAEPNVAAPRRVLPIVYEVKDDAPEQLRFVRVGKRVHCPAGIPMRPGGRRERREGVRERYIQQAQQCQSCALSVRCRGVGSSCESGRRIDLGTKQQEVIVNEDRLKERAPYAPAGVRSKQAKERRKRENTEETEASRIIRKQRTQAPPCPYLLLWRQLPSCTTRRKWQQEQHGMRVEGEVREATMEPRKRSTHAPPDPIQNRAQRAHRRNSLLHHLQRNAFIDVQTVLLLHGISRPLAGYLGIRLRD